MRRHKRIVAAAVLWMLGAAGLAAANFWDTKPYTDWSQKEVEEMLTDSPWARQLSVVVQSPPRPTEDTVGRGGGGGDTGGRGFPVPSPQLKLVLTWRTALPVRQALARLPIGAASAAGIDQLPLPERPPYYLITLSGVPARYARVAPSATATTFLRRGKKAPIALAQGAVQQDGANTTLFFLFLRTDPITLEDKDVEFATTIGTLEIKKKFTLKDLVVNGQLEL